MRERLALLLFAICACARGDAVRDVGEAAPQLAGAPASATAAAAARVVIDAALPDPVRAPDEAGEWVRLRNVGDADATLGGWRLLSSGDAGYTFAPGARLAAGATLVLVRSTDPARNGGVRGARALTGITLGNRADWLALHDARGRSVDSLAWSAARRGVEVTHDDATPPATPTSPAVVPAADTVPAGPRAQLEVKVLDIGQGDAILVRNGGSVALIDGGPDASALARHLDALGVRRGDTISLVVLSHAHSDHYAGLHELFRSRRGLVVRFFVENGDASPNAGLKRLRDSVAARVQRGQLVFRDADDPCGDGRAMCTFTLRGGAKLHVLRPSPNADDPNDRSMAVKLVAPDSAFTMLLAGDAEQRGMTWLLGQFGTTPGLDVDVLKANHHGSCNGVTPAWLTRTTPAWVVASLAAVNDYGHMHAQARAAYRAAHVPWYRTDQNGTITIRSPGTGGARYSVQVERGAANADGPSDRAARCP